MPGSSATKALTTGSEVAAETGNAAAPGSDLYIQRGRSRGIRPLLVAVGVVRLQAPKERDGIVERDSKDVDNFSNDIHVIMLQDRPEEKKSRMSAGARMYLRT